MTAIKQTKMTENIQQNPDNSNLNYQSNSIDESIAEKYGVPFNDLKYVPGIKINHDDVVGAVVDKLKQLDFTVLSLQEDGGRISKYDLHVIVVDEFLATAKNNKFALCIYNGIVYVYNGEYWKYLPGEVMKHVLGKAAIKLGIPYNDAMHYNFKEALLKQFYSSAFLPHPKRKNDEVRIALENGTFLISQNEQRLCGFDHADFITHQLKFAYDPGAVAPKFQTFLDEVLPDRDAQRVLSQYIGYVLIPNNVLSLEKALVLFGSGANGKSVVFSIISALLGSENVSNYSLESLTDANGYYRAKLSLVLLNYSSEISSRMDTTFFKQLVSGEPIQARLPYKEPFTISDYARLMFNTNVLPRDVEQNEAFFRRFMIIPFNTTIPEDKRDPDLAKKIIASELPGIFNWVLDGLRSLLETRKFAFSKTIADMVSEYKKKSDTVHMFIEDENYTVDFNGKLFVKGVYESYSNYCRLYGFKSCSLKSFTERLRSLGVEVSRTSEGNIAGLKN
jgi:putative DNA primase/helicase